MKHTLILAAVLTGRVQLAGWPVGWLAGLLTRQLASQLAGQISHPRFLPRVELEDFLGYEQILDS